MRHKLLGNLTRGLVFVISAPAGTGKTTLARMLCTEFDCVVESVSYTTREPRSKEKEGRDYHFITEAQFKEKIAQGNFLEYAKVFSHYYGTSRSDVEDMINRGKHVVLVIDTQGALQLMDQSDAVFIFISPPDSQELRKRLLNRQSESEAAIEERLSRAEEEMKAAKKYDYHIVNDHLQTAYQALRSILIAEEHRVR